MLDVVARAVHVGGHDCLAHGHGIHEDQRAGRQVGVVERGDDHGCVGREASAVLG